MHERIQKTKPYTLAILHKTAKLNYVGANESVWGHERRNFELRSEGKLNIVCPVRDDSDISGSAFSLPILRTGESFGRKSRHESR